MEVYKWRYIKLKIKITISIIIAALILFLPSCSSKDSNYIPKSEDIIIPPEPDVDPRLFNNRNVGSISNSYQQNIVNRLYNNIGSGSKIIDFDVNENNIYVLNKEGFATNNTEYGGTIDVYGIEDSLKKASIPLADINKCTSLTVHDYRVYAYDFDNGNILVYSVSGNLQKTVHSGFSGLNLLKMQADSDTVYLMASGTKIEDSIIYVVDLNGSYAYTIDKSGLLSHLKYPQNPTTSQAGISIQDFCIKDNHSILIKIVPERLCLYNIASRKADKISYIPDSAMLIDFDSDILYYTSGIKLSVLNNSFANFSSEGSSNYVGRLLVNNNFQWSLEPSSLVDFQLGDIIIPFGNNNLHHSKMKQNNKYVFFLNNSALQEADENNAGSLIYRITK